MTNPLVDHRHLLGHPFIDTEHAAIGELWLRAVSCDRREFPLHLARLKKAMERHFEHEADLLAEVGRGLCASHRAEHRSLLDLCSDASALHGRDWRRSQSLLRNKFVRMVREHIISMDQCAVLTMRTAIAPCDHATVN
jgi:hemerythrin